MPTPTVLLVDAHEDSRLIYAAAFHHYGFSVVALASCVEAVEHARLDPPELLVLAVEQPAAAAWDALRRLKGEPSTAGIPIVAVSTTGMREHCQRAVELGCAEVLVKPLPPRELLAAARRLLDGFATSAA